MKKLQREPPALLVRVEMGETCLESSPAACHARGQLPAAPLSTAGPPPCPRPWTHPPTKENLLCDCWKYITWLRHCTRSNNIQKTLLTITGKSLETKYLMLGCSQKWGYTNTRNAVKPLQIMGRYTDNVDTSEQEGAGQCIRVCVHVLLSLLCIFEDINTYTGMYFFILSSQCFSWGREMEHKRWGLLITCGLKHNLLDLAFKLFTIWVLLSLTSRAHLVSPKAQETDSFCSGFHCPVLSLKRNIISLRWNINAALQSPLHHPLSAHALNVCISHFPAWHLLRVSPHLTKHSWKARPLPTLSKCG